MAEKKHNLIQTNGATEHTYSRLIWPAVLVALVILFGVLGYQIIEGWNFFDAFYMTMISITTVGFTEVHALSDSGRAFTVVIVLCGVSVATYSFSTIVSLIVEGELTRVRGRKKMRRQIEGYNNHYIVCGYGRLGNIVAHDLLEADESVVVIDPSPPKIIELEFLGIPFIEGNSFDEHVLTQAGVQRAKALVALIPSDADNVYTCLCAREMNPQITIFARAEHESGLNRLRRAGADQVFFPYRVTGNQMVQRLIRPHVSDFLELTVGTGGQKLALEEVVVPKGSPLSEKTLEETELRSRTGVVIAAFIEPDGNMHFSPGGKSVIKEGSTLIVFGEKQSLQKLSELL